MTPAEALAVEAREQGITPLEALLRRGRLRATLTMLGPAFVASIAYVDPGNFATNIAGGARFGYLLLWVVLAANLMAMLIQYLSAKLGIVTDTQPSRELPGALPALDVLGNVGAGRDHLDVHRHRRVPRRGARAQPALPRPALHRRRDDRLHRLRPPRAAPPRVPPVRARDHGAARDHLPRLPLREPQDRPLRPRQHPELPAASPRLDRGPVPRGRDHRRDGHAARHLPPLGAHEGPHARPQRRRALPRASVRAHRRDHRPRPRRADQPDHARRRGEALPRRQVSRGRHDPGRAHRVRQPRRGQALPSRSPSPCSRPAPPRRASAPTPGRWSWPASSTSTSPSTSGGS